MAISKIVMLIIVVVIFIATTVALLLSKKVRTAACKLAFMPDGSFSLTRLVMAALAISSILLIWIGVLSKLLFDITLPNNIYTYVGSMTGGSILQYGVTKWSLIKGGTNGKGLGDNKDSG